MNRTHYHWCERCEALEPCDNSYCTKWHDEEDGITYGSSTICYDCEPATPRDVYEDFGEGWFLFGDGI
jgi:hypothetical protein